MTRLSRLTPLSGVVFVGLLVLAGPILAGEPPTGNAGTAHVISFYQAHRDRIEMSSWLMALSLLPGLYFYATLRERLRDRANIESLAAFAGVILFAVGGALSAGSQFAIADMPRRPNPAAAQALNLLQADLTTFVLAGGSCVLLVAFGTAVLRDRQLPAWLGWAAVCSAVVAIPPVRLLSLSTVLLWTFTASIALYRHSPELDPLVAAQPTLAT